MTIDKHELYETFNNSLRRGERLTDLATRKALDLPVEDDVQIITHNQRGLGRCATLLLCLSMLASGGGAALGVVGMLNGFAQHAASTGDVTPPAATQEFPVQEFKVTFWDEEGTNLEVHGDE